MIFLLYIVSYAKFHFHEAEFQFISPTGKYEKKHDTANIKRCYLNSSAEESLR